METTSRFAVAILTSIWIAEGLAGHDKKALHGDVVPETTPEHASSKRNNHDSTLQKMDKFGKTFECDLTNTTLFST